MRSPRGKMGAGPTSGQGVQGSLRSGAECCDPPPSLRVWRGLFLRGVIVGLLGYSVGNHMGLAVFFLVRGAGLGL